MAEQAPLSCTCEHTKIERRDGLIIWAFHRDCGNVSVAMWPPQEEHSQFIEGVPVEGACPHCGDGLYFDTAGNPQVERRAGLVPKAALEWAIDNQGKWCPCSTNVSLREMPMYQLLEAYASEPDYKQHCAIMASDLPTYEYARSQGWIQPTAGADKCPLTDAGRAVLEALRKADKWAEDSERLNALDRHYYGQNAELVSFHRPSNWDSDPLSRTNPARGLGDALMRAERDLAAEKEA